MFQRYLFRVEHRIEPCHLTLTGIPPGNVTVKKVIEAAAEMSNETNNLKFAIVLDCLLDFYV